MVVEIGRLVSRYRILSPIGAGGMGEVWRARDERLGRDVAVKVVARGNEAAPERTARFLREARAAAALDHPNILVVHDAGEQDGVPFLVSELLEGETLRQRLDRDGRLATRQALAIGVQVLHGLARAHAAGIVHRDVKPENLFLTHDGRVKILDFGVARLTGIGPGEASTAGGSLTSAGVALGTVAYMSPEQVRGQEVDARSDLWSFGAVLYELLAGRRAFRGDTAADTITAILTADPPDLAGTVAGVHPTVERVIGHCLERAPEARFQSASDVAFALENAGVGSSGAAAAAAGPRSRGRRIAAAAALLAAVALAAVAIKRFWPVPPAAAATSWSVERLTDLPGVEGEPSISPDGKSVVYVRGGDLWLVRVGGSRPLALTPESPGRDFAPAFSPDGQWIAFNSQRSGGGIFVMGATGENVRRVTRRGFRPAWTPDGRELVYAFTDAELGWDVKLTSGLEAVEVASGRTRRLCDCVAAAPAVSPHGSRVAFWGTGGVESGFAQRDVWTVPLAGLRPGEGPVRATNDAAADWDPQWSPDGRALEFVSDRGGSPNLWSLPVDESSGAVRGAALPRTLPSALVAHTRASAGGDLRVFQDAVLGSVLQRAELDLRRGELASGPRELFRLTHMVGGLRSGAVSPDGQMLALTGGPRMDDIVLLAVDGSQARTLVAGPFRCRAPAWSPDGRTIAFGSDRGGRYEIWGIGVDGADLRPLMRSARGLLAPVWSPDGTLLQASEVVEVGTSFRPVIHRVGDPPERLEPLPPLPDGDEFEGTAFSHANDALLGYGTSGKIWRWRLRERRYELLLEGDPSFWRKPDVELADGRLLLSGWAPARPQAPPDERVRVVDLFDPRTGTERRLVTLEQPFEGGIGARGSSVWISTHHQQADLWIARRVAPPQR